MENSLSLSDQPLEKCGACFTDVAAEDAYCSVCQYPLKGTEMEQKTFIAMRDNLDMDRSELNKKIRKAAVSLYYLAGIFFVYAIINFFVLKDEAIVGAVVISYLILAMLFLALGGLSAKKPLTCLISGLSLYVIVQILFIVINPVNILSGIIIK